MINLLGTLMKVKTFLLILFFILPNMSAAANQPDSKWQIDAEHPQYKIFTKAKTGSEFLQTKAVIAIPTSSINVLKQFGDGDNCWSWQKRCEKTKVIKKLSDNEQIIYVAIDMPWPISNREFLVRSHSQRSNDNKAFIIKLTPENELAYKEGYVQGAVNSEYTITRIGPNKTRVTIVMHTEFAGSVSGSLINSKLVNELEADVKALIQESLSKN